MKKRFLIILIMIAALASLAAQCSVKLSVINLSAPATVKAGETVQLTSDVEGVSFALVESDELATVSESGLISVKENAAVGSVIKAIAVKGDVTSNVVQIVVISSSEITTIALTYSAPSVMAGGTVQLISDTEGVTFHLVDSDNLATISASGLITANANAETGSVIKAVAKKGETTSNTVQIVVISSNEITTIALTYSAPSVKAGETVQLISDTEGVTFHLVDSDNLATISASGLITANANAETGSVIKAVAKKGEITSNTVQIVVIGEKVDEKIILTPSVPSVKAGGTVQLISDTDDVTFQLVASDAYATISASGLITVKATAVAGNVIKAVAQKDGITSNEVSIVVIEDRIVLSVSNPTVKAGGTVQLISDTSGVTFHLVASDAYATISASGLITAKSTAVVGNVIKAVAKKGNITSNEVSIVVIEEKIVLSVLDPTVKKGGTVQLISDTSGVTFHLVASDAYATISASGLITVKSTAVAGNVIKAVAKKGNITSNEIAIAVVDEKIVLTASAPSVKVGETIQLTSDTEGVTFKLVDSDSLATINANGLITVKSTAAIGAIIKAVAQKGSVTSNTVQIVIVEEIPLTAITIDASATEVVRGGTVQFYFTLKPTNTTETNITFEIVSGTAHADISASGLLTVDTAEDGAVLGEEIKVRAKRGSIVSNVITVTVREARYYLNNKNVHLEDNTLIIKNTDATNTPALLFEVIDDKTNKVYGMDIEYTVKTGDGVVTITTNQQDASVAAGVCRVNQRTHGDAEIEVKLKDGSGNVLDSDIVFVSSIKTPTQVDLPEYLEDSLTQQGMTKYTVGKNQAFGYNARIPNLTVAGSTNFGACTTIKYEFELLDVDGDVIKSGDEVAVYQDGKITFKYEGAIRVRAITDSGNAPEMEKSISHIFNVNNYQNIGSWEELKTYLESGAKNTTRALNLVVTERPAVGYGFSLVPFFVLDGGADHGFNETNLEILQQLYVGREPASDAKSSWVYLEHIGISVIDKSVIINGNNHALDFSKVSFIDYPKNVPLISIKATQDAEVVGGATSKMLMYLAKSIGLHTPNLSGSTPAEILNPQYGDDAPIFTVQMDSVKFFGNTDIDGKNLISKQQVIESDGKGTIRLGTHQMALDIGNYLTRANYEIKLNNIEISHFQKAMSIHRAISEVYEGTTFESKLSNLNIKAIYGTAIEVAMSQLELFNSTFGFTGAVPIEALFNFSHMAGIKENQKQRIDISGKFDPGLINNGNTQYYKDYTVIEVAGVTGGIKFHPILNAFLSSLTKYQTDHVTYTGASFLFSLFAFNDPFFADSLKAEAATSAQGANPIIPAQLLSQQFTMQAICEKLGVIDQTELGKNHSEINFLDGATEVKSLSSIQENEQNTTAKYILMDVLIDGSKVPGADNQMYSLGWVYVGNALYQD